MAMPCGLLALNFVFRQVNTATKLSLVNLSRRASKDSGASTVQLCRQAFVSDAALYLVYVYLLRALHERHDPSYTLIMASSSVVPEYASSGACDALPQIATYRSLVVSQRITPCI